jgi:hypothetical protein
LKGYDCNLPGRPEAGSCFFDLRTYASINADEEKKNETRTPSITFEENEFAVPYKNIRSALTDIKTVARNGFGVGANVWPPSIIYARPGASTPDWIAPLSGDPHERFVWMELAVLRSNIPKPSVVSTVPRVNKKLPGIQEFFEQLMVCK